MRFLARVLAFPTLLLAGLSGLAFYDRYWRWRDCFNDLGRCWDPVGEQVYLEQAGAIWAGLAVLFAIIASLLVRLGWPRRKAPPTRAP